MKYTLEQALKAKEELKNSELYLLGFNSAKKEFKKKYFFKFYFANF